LNQSFSRSGSRNGVGSHHDRHRNTIDPEGLDDLKILLGAARRLRGTTGEKNRGGEKEGKFHALAKRFQ
jgi:hypothetical protein